MFGWQRSFLFRLILRVLLGLEGLLFAPAERIVLIHEVLHHFLNGVCFYMTRRLLLKG